MVQNGKESINQRYTTAVQVKTPFQFRKSQLADEYNVQDHHGN